MPDQYADQIKLLTYEINKLKKELASTKAAVARLQERYDEMTGTSNGMLVGQSSIGRGFR